MTGQWVTDALASKLLDQDQYNQNDSEKFFPSTPFRKCDMLQHIQRSLRLGVFLWNLKSSSATSDPVSIIFHWTPLLPTFCEDFKFFIATHFLYAFILVYPLKKINNRTIIWVNCVLFGLNRPSPISPCALSKEKNEHAHCKNRKPFLCSSIQDSSSILSITIGRHFFQVEKKKTVRVGSKEFYM